MTEEKLTDAITELDEDVLQRYYAMKQSLTEKKQKKPARVRRTAIAACLALLVGAAFAVPGVREGASTAVDLLIGVVMNWIDPAPANPPWTYPPGVEPPVVEPPVVDPPALGVEPYMPGDAPWSPVIHSRVNQVTFNTDDLHSIIEGMITLGTTQYERVYAAAEAYLKITPLPQAEYWPVYTKNKRAASKDKLNDFINRYLESATAFFGVESKEYEIHEYGQLSDNIYYDAAVGGIHKKIWFTAKDNWLSFYYTDHEERRLRVNGRMVSVSATDTDEQIMEKLKDTIDYACAAFGKHYTDVKISRRYSQEQLIWIYIYLYTPKETILPPDFVDRAGRPVVSEYMMLSLSTDRGPNTGFHWGGSKDEAFVTGLTVREAEEKWSEYYSVDQKVKMLTLEEAERLLEKGYVFGGHSCPICMANQPEVDFSDYTCVSIEYLAGLDVDIYIPFYTFYKYIGETSAGIGTYAKTYVPAVEIEGLEEYFKQQESRHPK